MSKKSVGYVHLQWTCPYCDAKNKGVDKKCVNCAAAQPDDVQFEQKAQEEIITDETIIAKAKAGADVHCAYCGTRNEGGTAVCQQCGADLNEGTKRESGHVVGAYRADAAPSVACPYCGSENPADAAVCQNCGAHTSDTNKTQQQQPPSPPAQKKQKLPIGIIIGIVLFLIACCGFLFLSNRTEDEVARVDGVEWKRTINIEALAPVTHNTWEDEIPSNAIRVGTCVSKKHHTQSSPPSTGESTEMCGTPYTIDQGSGLGEVVQDCEYIVYAQWCDYTVEEWAFVREMTAGGTDMNPYWPQTNLSTGERNGAQNASYTVHFAADGQSYTYQTTNESEYMQYQVGTEWILKVNTFGSINEITAP